jgi:hypothetical protein
MFWFGGVRFIDVRVVRLLSIRLLSPELAFFRSSQMMLSPR